jgi:hypothetical protein
MTSLEVLTHDQRAQEYERSPYVLATAGLRADSDKGRGESMRAWASGLV